MEPTTTIKPEPKPDSENGTVFAIDFNEPGTTKFYKRDRVPDAGEVFEGKTVEADNIYTGSRMSELNSDTLYTSIWDNTDRFKARSVEVVDSGIKLSNLPKFHDTHNISSLNLTKLDTSQETSFYRLFDTIDKLCVLDVSTWDTSSVTNMNDCFNACGSKSTQTFTVDLSGWDTSSVTYMDEMFQDSNIKVKGLRNFDTSKVISMCSMFSGSPAANKDIENWNTSSLENIHYMFSYSTSTDSLNLSKWNVSQVNDFESLFKNSKFNSLNLSGWNVSGSEQLDYPDRVLQFMFSGCSASNIDVSNWNISNVDDTSSMFEGCSALTRIVGISDWNTKRLNLVYSMFKDCPNLVLDLSGWNVEYVNTLLPLDFNT